MEKKNKYITVLDFEVGIVFQYRIEVLDSGDNKAEEFITDKGHRLNNCEWMIHEFKGFHVTNCITN